jgi:eukaryotic-like serine/threonine-protein kinase
MSDPTPDPPPTVESSEKSDASAATATSADEDFLAALAEEFGARLRRREHASVEEYATKHPALADRIRNVLAAVALMEQSRSLDSAHLAAGERLETTIGRYKLLERLGEGGHGVVYMAEQQTPVRRTVALKVIKPGLDSSQVIARFDAERQALALMDHVNIAKVLDAGATETGRPYFVMELVRGVPITQFCDDHRLPPRERLALFVKVCRAVQHAHTKGIIHRDLKPTNILVTLQDGVAVPKVIDFGVAKATGQQLLTDRTLFTHFAQMIGTPLYMSPEQAELSGLDIDTRSDVYSLGVLLYELLTGTTPFEKERLKKAAYDEVRRIIREEEPPRPSTRLSTLGETLASVSATRQTDPKELTRAVRGELDWIVMRALEKERARRYETANAFARDIERYLSDEPVEACPPSRAYRLRKFARRHKAPLTMTAVVAAVLLVATVVSTWQALRATRAEQRVARERDQALAEKRRADQQAAIAQAINEFLNNDVLGQADPHNQAAGDVPADRDLKVREALDRAAVQIEGRFGAQPLLEASIRHAVGSAYRGVAEFDKAENHLATALSLRRSVLGNLHADTFSSLSALAALYVEQGRYVDAEPLISEALDGARKTLGPNHPRTIGLVREMGELYLWQVQLTKAEPLLLEALRGSREVLGESHEETLITAAHLASLYADQRRFEEAEPLMLRATEGLRTALGPYHPDRLAVLQNFAVVYSAQGKFDKSVPLLREALDGLRQALGEQHPETLYVLHNLGAAYFRMGHLDEAEKTLRQALQGRRSVLGKQHRVALGTLDQLAQVHVAQKRFADAEELYREGLAIRRQWPLPDSPDRMPLALIRLASVLRLQRRDVEAEPLLRESLQIRQQVLPADDHRIAQAKSMLGATMVAVGKLEEAEPLLLAAYEGLSAHPPPPLDPEQPKVTVERTIQLYEKWGKPEQAAAWRAKLPATQPAIQPSAVTRPADRR